MTAFSARYANRWHYEYSNSHCPITSQRKETKKLSQIRRVDPFVHSISEVFTFNSLHLQKVLYFSPSSFTNIPSFPTLEEKDRKAKKITKIQKNKKQKKERNSKSSSLSSFLPKSPNSLSAALLMNALYLFGYIPGDSVIVTAYVLIVGTVQYLSHLP